MPRVKLFKKTKEQIKDEKILRKEMVEFEQDYEQCRDLIIKVEEHFHKLEPSVQTEQNPFYKEPMSDLDFMALLTDFRYPISDTEKFIIFQWTFKDENGKVSFSNMRESITAKFAEMTKKYRAKEERSLSLQVAKSNLKWVSVVFRLSGFSAFKMKHHSFKKVVTLSSSGAYLRSLIMHEIPDLPGYSILLSTDSRIRHDNLMSNSDTLESMGIIGGTVEFPGESVLHYDFSIDKRIQQPIIDNIKFIKNLPRHKLFRCKTKTEHRNVAVTNSLSNSGGSH